MTDILITSSVLILALLILRRLFKNTISRRAGYALWALVLIRLLVPVNLPYSDLSLLNAAKPVVRAVDHAFHATPVYLQPIEQYPASEYPGTPDATVDSATILWDPVGNRPDGYLALDPDGETVTKYAVRTYHGDMILAALAVIWKAGMAVVGGFFLLSNLAFYVRLRKTRTEWTPTVARKVYLVPDGVIPSPCLFGNVIYLTPAALGSEESLRHVLLHEETHAKHWDPLWAFLRCVCLTVYWFDPLVWVAALCSRTDCELACDEAVLVTLGEDERIPYGQTLLSLIPVKGRDNPLLTATTMTAGKKQLKDRISRIARNPRQTGAALVAVALLALVISACTFSDGGYLQGDTYPTPEPTQSMAEAPEPTPDIQNILNQLLGQYMGEISPPPESPQPSMMSDHMAEGANGTVWVWTTNAAALQVQSDLDRIMEHSELVRLELKISGEGPKSIYGITPGFDRGLYIQTHFTDPDTFRWSRAESGVSSPDRTVLLIYDPDYDQYLTFTEGSDIVRSIGKDGSATYYRAEPAHPEDEFSQDIFSFMRAWYDEAEAAVLRGKYTLVPNEGQSDQEIAEAITDAEGQVNLHATPGSMYTYTYVKAVDAEALEDVPEGWFPEDIAQFSDYFAFSYTSIFVPENPASLRRALMAGAVAYDGDDPDVPEGALQIRYRGTMVLIEEGWCCFHYETETQP